MTTYRAVYNSKMDQWKICHTDWCEKGETSVVAIVLTSLNPEADAALARRIAAALTFWELSATPERNSSDCAQEVTDSDQQRPGGIGGTPLPYWKNRV